jgi:adenylate cyclase
MASRNFFAELKRRNVVRMAGLYLVGAWLIVQVASTVLPMPGAPEWLPRSIVILLVIGSIPALIFSWFFELTPQGLKRDEEVPPEQSIAPQTGRRMGSAHHRRAGGGARLFCFRQICPDTAARGGVHRENRKIDCDAAHAGIQAFVNANSVAVLAFANLSGDKGSEYFSDGINEELLTV